MAHFAKIDENNIVTTVVVAEQDFIDSGVLGDPTKWIQTSYNTHAGEHKLGGTPLRKNYAGVGYTYDSNRDAFIPQKPYNSWTLNEQTCMWEPPVQLPSNDKEYSWNEADANWQEIIE